MPPKSRIASDCASQTRSAYVPSSLAMTNADTVSLATTEDGFGSSRPRTIASPSTRTPSTCRPSDALARTRRPETPGSSGDQVPGIP